MSRLAVIGDAGMIKSNQELYTFRGASPEQVADLCELWEGSVVEYSQRRGIVRVEADPISIDQFCMIYETYEYLESCGPVDVQLYGLGTPH